MDTDMALRPLLLFVLAFALGTILASARGDDFRVETKVYQETETEAAFETLTVFSGDVVYDFVLGRNSDQVEAKIVTVFDPRHGRIVLLDADRKMQAELTTQQLADFSASIRKLATDDRENELFNPVFTVTFEEATSQITMTSSELTYRVEGESPKDRTAAKRYSNFADWFARLNAARGNVPPFGRIELNRILNEKGLLPVKIERTAMLPVQIEGTALRKKKKSTARSEHASYWTLSNTDRRRIDHAGHLMANLRTVSLKEYWGIEADVAATQ